LRLVLTGFFFEAVFAMADKDKPATNFDNSLFVYNHSNKYLSRTNDTRMIRPKAIFILLVVFFGFFSSPADAQVNLKTGYNISFLSNPGFDQLITRYNQSQSYQTNFHRLRWMHGFEMGLRLKDDIHAVELTYQAAFQGLKGVGLVGVEEYTDRLKLGIHSLALGYQASDKVFGAGVDLQYQLYKVRFLPGISSTSFKDLQSIIGLKFYLMATLRGRKGVDMALQPYYVLPFKSYDLGPVSQFLQIEPSPPNHRWNRFGLTILFYNGQK